MGKRCYRISEGLEGTSRQHREIQTFRKNLLWLKRIVGMLNRLTVGFSHGGKRKAGTVKSRQNVRGKRPLATVLSREVGQ